MALRTSPDKEFSFDEVKSAPLVVDAVYRGGRSGNAADDPIARLLPVGNQGGFRFYGKRAVPGCRLVVLFSTFAEPDWPDHLDPETGQVTYFGDNRRPGHELHDTPRGGNRLLRLCFDAIHASPPRRGDTPPFLVFSRLGDGRDVRFRGLAVPGTETAAAVDDLVAIWRTSGDQRFQNYRALFTILDVPVIGRDALQAFLEGQSRSPDLPQSWRDWVEVGRRRALEAPKTRVFRSRAEQTPRTDEEIAIIRELYEYFKNEPVRFEACAVEFARMVAPNIVDCDLTRPWMDGGRDAVGHYRLGPLADAIKAEFALEAKCYAMENAVGVEHTSRLISRIRFRQFGILVTTSWVHPQAYREIRDDGHPVVILCARDLVDLLKAKGIASRSEVLSWLKKRFPISV